MLRLSILFFIIALGLIAGLAIHFADDQPVLYTYTGVEFCKGCHVSTAAGEIFQSWEGGPHARARHTLDSSAARQYLSENHAEITQCLTCHTTLGRPGLNDHEQIVNSEGVGCERCHGPGSSYSQTVIMKDREAFIHNGGSPGSLKNCYSCHVPNPDSGTAHCPFQTKPFDAATSWLKIAHSIRTSRSNSDSTLTGSDSTNRKEQDTVPKSRRKETTTRRSQTKR